MNSSCALQAVRNSVFVLLFIFGSATASAGTITVNSLNVGSNLAGDDTTYTFELVLPTNVTSGGGDGAYIWFDFPDIYGISASSTLSVSPHPGGGSHTTNRNAGSARIWYYKSGGSISAGTYTVTLGNITNPGAANASPGNIYIDTRDGGGTTFDSVNYALPAITANTSPTVTDPLPDTTGVEASAGSQQYIADLNDHFTDGNGDTMDFTAVSSDSTTVAVTTSGANGRTLSIEAKKYGTATITVTASDNANGESIDDDFTVGAIGELTVNSVSALQTMAGEETEYTFEVVVPTNVDNSGGDGGYIVFDFPDDFDFTNAAFKSISPSLSGVSTGAKSTANRTVAAWRSGNSIPANTYTVVFEGIKNPASDGSYGNILVDTRDGGGTTFDKGTIASPAISATSIPTVSSNIADQNGVLEADGVQELISDLNNNFTDGDGDTLTFTVSSSDSSTVAATVSGANGQTLSIEAKQYGSATITVTATAADGAVDDVFTVNAIGQLTVNSVTEATDLGGATGNYAFEVVVPTLVDRSNGDGSYIVFDFPDDYDVSSAAFVSITGAGAPSGSVLGAYSTGNATVGIYDSDENIPAGTYTVTFSGITNPSSGGSAGDITVDTRDGGGTVFDIGSIAGPVIYTKPVFNNSTPSVTGTNINSTTLQVSLDQTGTAYWVVLADGATAPSASQVKAGDDSTGADAPFADSFAIGTADTILTDSISGLAVNTSYDIYVVAENSAASPHIQDSATKVDVMTLGDVDGSVAAGALSEPSVISTTVDTVGEAVDLFDFTVSDGGTSDGSSLDISQIVINTESAGLSTESSNYGKLDWILNGNGASDVAGVYSSGANTITFSGLTTSIADGTSETFVVSAYFNDNTGLTEDKVFFLEIDGDIHITEAAGSATSMAATSPINNGSGAAIDVLATKLVFTTEPAGSVSGAALTTQPQLTAQDPFGNTDIDFVASVGLSEASAGALSGTTALNATAGVANFTDIVYSATADGESFVLTAAASGVSDASSASVNSNVVASTYRFATEPAPVSIATDSLTAFTTVPAVEAVDADGIRDTDFVANVTLSEVNGAGSALLSGTGDTDGDGATVTLSATAGLANFTGLTVNYSNSGTADETFNLQASGSLTSATSTGIESVSAPVVTSVDLPADDLYGIADTLDFVVNFNETVIVTGVPQLNISVGSQSYEADYESGSNSTALTFRYTVASGDEDLDGVAVNSLGLNSGTATIADLEANNASVTLNSVGSGVNVLVDGIAPTVQSQSIEAGDFKAGDTIDFTLTLDEDLDVSGTASTLTIDIGGTQRAAVFISEDAGTLRYRYTVQEGDEDNDGVSLVADGLVDNGDTFLDPAGNDADFSFALSSNANSLVDTVAPVDPVVTKPETGILVNELTQNIRGEHSENGVTINLYRDSNNDGVADNDTVLKSGVVAGNEWSVKANLTANANNDFVVAAVDAAGNRSGDSDVLRIRNDNQPPSGHSVSFVQTLVTQANENSIGFNLADAESGTTASYSISSSGGGSVSGSSSVGGSGNVSGINVASLGDGTLTLSVVLQDDAGNSATAVTATVSKDATPPVLSLVAAVSSPTTDTSPGFIFSSNEAGTLSVGGSCGTSSSTSVSAATNTAIVLTAADNSSGLDSGTYSNCSVTVTDSIGNSSAALAIASFTIDASGPGGHSVSLSTSNINAATGAVSFQFSNAEVGASFTYTISSSGGGATVSGSGTIASGNDIVAGIDLSGLADGTLQLSVILTDSLGNESEAVLETGIIKDTEAPEGHSVVIEQNPINADNAGAVSFRFSDAETGGSFSYTVSSDGGGSLDGSGNISASDHQESGLDWSELGDGALSLSVILTDSAGNSATAVTANTNKDTAPPPAPTVTSPASQQTLNTATATIAGSHSENGSDVLVFVDSDNDGVADSDSAAASAVVASGAWSVSINLSENASNNFVVLAEDPNGNRSAAVDVPSLIQDSTAPEGYAAAFSQSLYNNSDASSASLLFSDLEVGAGFNYVVDDGTSQLNGSGSADASSVQIDGVDLSGFADGTLTVTLTQTDAAGNNGSAVTATAQLDGAAPTLSELSAVGSPVASGNPAYSFFSSEAGSLAFSGSCGSATSQAIAGNNTINLTADDGSSALISRSYSDCSLSVTDAAGNSSSPLLFTAFTVDLLPPAGYSVAFTEALFNAANVTQGAFVLSNAEVGAAYSYVISSAGGAAEVSGSGVADASEVSVSGIDLSGLDDGQLSISLAMSDVLGNSGSAVGDASARLDATPPVVSLLGEAPLTIEIGSVFSDPGASAADNIDGNLDAMVVGTGSVDTSAVGAYLLSYDVSDAAGNPAITVQRQVNVVDTAAPELMLPADAVVEAESAEGTSASNSVIVDFLGAVTAQDAVDGAIALINDDAPATFPLGSTVVTFSATDNSDNTGTGTATVTVIDTTAPVLTAPAAIELESDDASGIAATDSAIVAFLGAATVSDLVDGANPAVSDDSPAVFPVGTTVVTFSATDSSGNTGTAQSTVSVLSDDSDGDGIADVLEIALGLDPNDPNDAMGDLDGDGISNIDEVMQGSDPLRDEIAPELIAPDAVSVLSTGPTTPVDLGEAQATDNKDPLLFAVADNSGPFVPGRHIVTWTVSDEAGNSSSAEQIVDVIPQVNFVASQSAGEGSSVTVSMMLNGNAVEYPVTVPLAVSGTASAGVDHDLGLTSLSIDSGTSASFSFNVFSDSEAEASETVVITMGTPVNAVAGNSPTHTVSIVDGNLAPSLTLTVQQGGELVTTVVATNEPVTVNVAIDDPNPGDSFTIDWSDTRSELVPIGGFDGASFQFDPAAVAPDVYQIKVTVTDDGAPVQSTAVDTLIRVVAEEVVLEDNVDTDGDGISDAEEGSADSDNDGIPDYQDAIDEENLLQSDDEGSVLQTDTGLSLSLGETSFASGNSSAQVSTDDVLDNGGDGGGIAAFRLVGGVVYPTGLFDFKVSGLEPGASVRIVIPLTSPIPSAAFYQKYSDTNGWQSFVQNSNNSVASAPGEPGVCPAPGHESYESGLRFGYYCVQLTIEDGGPNDTDGMVNGVVEDPGGVAIEEVEYTCQQPELSGSESTVIDAYIAYFGRPADAAGLEFWSQQLDEVDGDLRAIIDAFGNSEEFDRRFGDLSDTNLVNNIYQQLFQRDADAAGLAFYVGSLQAGSRSLQTIALDVLNGATNEDVVVLEARRLVAADYLLQTREAGLGLGEEDLATLLDSVVDEDSANASCANSFVLMEEAASGETSGE